MERWVDFGDKVKKYYKHSPTELRTIIITVIVMSFIVSFKKFFITPTSIDISTGLKNLILALLIVGISFLFRDMIQRFSGLSVGYRVEYKMWAIGLLIGFIITLVSKGRLWFIIPGAILTHFMPGHRLGHIRYGPNIFGMGLIAGTGPLASVIIALIFKYLYNFFQFEIFRLGVLFNVLYAVWTILPLPGTDGIRFLYGSRMAYAFMFIAIISASILIYTPLSIGWIVLLTILIAIIGWVFYWILIESKLWPRGVLG